MAAIVAGAAVALHLVCISQYGIFRDEMYFVACSKHLAWGYVDQPPMIAVLIWIARHLFGESLAALRILAVLGHAGVVLLTAAIARRLGGSVFAQTLAAICAALAPIFLSLGHVMTMNIFEPLFWMGCVYVALVIFDGGSEKLWLVFGLLAGLGLQNKQSTLFFGVAFVIGMLATKERRHARAWIWLGGALAFLIFLPNLWWQYAHHWPMIELLHNIDRSGKNAPVSPLGFFSGQAILMNPVTLPLWLGGVVWLLIRPRFRFLGVAFVALFVLFVVMKGKIYYLSPMMPLVLAAGSVAAELAARRRALRAVLYAYTALIVITAALIAPLAIPILPVETFIAYEHRLPIGPPKTESHEMGPLPQFYADMFGWQELTQAVARAYSRLTPAERAKAGIFGQNYGEAGAIDYFGARYGLPHAISGHQNYFYWGPDNCDGSVMIVMADNRERLLELFDSVEPAAEFDHPYAMPYERHDTIYICRGLKMPMSELWPKIRKWI